MINDCTATLTILSVARAERGPDEPRLVQFMREIPGDAIAALKVVVGVLEMQGVLCETSDMAIERATAAGFVPYHEADHPFAEQMATVLIRYPAIGHPTATVRVTRPEGTTAFPSLSSFRERVPIS